MGSQRSLLIRLQLLVAVLASPQVQRYCRELVHNRNRQSRLGQIDTLQIGVADVHADVRDLRRRIICHLRFSFFSACRIVDSSKAPFMGAEHANQRFLCTVAFAPQYADDGLTAAERTRRRGSIYNRPFAVVGKIFSIRCGCPGRCPPSWPKWQKQIESVTAAGPLQGGTQFSWRTSGRKIHSQVQLFEPEHCLSWTGTALSAKAVHVWELEPEPGNQTLLTVKESMDGFLMAEIYPSRKLAETDAEWLTALKRAAEWTP